MKKKILILLLCMGSIILPSVVRADMGAPEIISYEVIVTNKNGAKELNGDVVIPYDTVCMVNYELKREEGLYLTVDCKGYEGSYDINAEDVRVLKEEYQPTSDYKLEEAVRYYVMNDVEMYSGPSYKYKMIGEIIPAGSIVTVTHIDSDEAWGYVEYNGKKGWLYLFFYENENVARVIDNEKEKNMITVRNITKLYKYPYDFKSSFDVSIPVGTLIKAEYHYPILKENGLFYVNYNGVSGWANSDDGIGYVDKGFILITDTSKVKVYDENGKNINLNIKKYQEFSYDYIADFYDRSLDKYVVSYAIVYNNKRYFLEICLEVDEYDVRDYKSGVIEVLPYKSIVKNDAPIYEDYDAKKIVGTLKLGERMDRRYAVSRDDGITMFYIKTDKLSGWVDAKYIEEYPYEEDEELADIIDKPFTTTMSIMTTPKTEGNDNTANKLGTKEIVTMCVIGSIVLALIVIVVIVLINKKKSIKKDEKIETSSINDENNVLNVSQDNKETVNEINDNMNNIDDNSANG